MNRTTKCSPEVRLRAARMVSEHACDYPSEWVTIQAAAWKLGFILQFGSVLQRQ
jgi:hypothetical protein